MTRTGARASALWQALNERQRAYLEVAYAVDRENEGYQRSAWSRGGRAAPAETWRWLPFAADWPLPLCLRLRGLVDGGNCATFDALERRKLITCC